MTDKAHNPILIWYVLEIDKFVRVVDYAFSLVLCPRNELYVHELVNSVLAYSLNPL